MTTDRLSLAMRNVLVAIDDTDNPESRGTGHLSRQLAQHLDDLGVGSPLAVTRHQLFVDDRIPYTSHNSSACIALHCPQPPDLEAIVAAGAAFLEERSATGSDPGLAVATKDVWANADTRRALREYGELAKCDVLDQDAARALAAASAIHLSPHGGDGGGIIGALAAIGLHAGGNDGRILWMPNMRELTGELTYGQLKAAAPIDAALDPAGREPAPDDLITLGDWVRPILRDGRAVLLLDPAGTAWDEDGETLMTWAVAPREVVKTH